jgi:hypothetical protein
MRSKVTGIWRKHEGVPSPGMGSQLVRASAGMDCLPGLLGYRWTGLIHYCG